MDLEAMGRHALLFDDDAMADFVNSAGALVEWNSLQIDRYDVRHLLNAPLPPRAAHRSGGSKPCSFEGYDESDLDRERFLDLPSFFDDAGSSLFAKVCLPEVQVRTYALYTSSSFPAINHYYPFMSNDAVSVEANGFHTVPFSYGSHSESKIGKKTEAGIGFLPPFPLLAHLHQNLPSDEKIHQIMARTALFVVEHGGQSEIVLRVKQGDNPTFGFLMPSHHLHPYFRFLVDHKELLQQSLMENTLRENESAGGGALSLLGSTYGTGEEEEEFDGDDDLLKPPHSAPDAEQEQVSEKKSATASVAKEEVDMLSMESSSSSSAMGKLQGAASPAPRDASSSMAEPPKELKRVMEKIVQFVMRNGREFETVLIHQDAKHEKFPFLHPLNQFHAYYQKLHQNAHESKLRSRSVFPETAGVECGVTNKKSAGMDETGTICDLPDDSDRRGRFKMVIGRQVQCQEDNPCSSVKASLPPIGVKVDAAATAAILQAATKGLKNPDQAATAAILSKISANANSKLGQEKLDCSSVHVSQELKLKAERLRRAKMFAAMIKRGAAPLKVREGSADSSPPAEKFPKNSDSRLDRRSLRRYRPRPTSVELGEEEDVAVAHEESRKKRRSRRSSDESGERRRHHKHSSSSDKEHRTHRHERQNHDRRFSGDDDDDCSRRLRRTHARHDPSSSDCNDNDNLTRSKITLQNQLSHGQRRKHQRCWDSGDHSSDGDASLRKDKNAKKRQAEGREIIAGRHKSKRNEAHEGDARKASVEAAKSCPSMELVGVSNELRAKVRAMLMANM